MTNSNDGIGGGGLKFNTYGIEAAEMNEKSFYNLHLYNFRVSYSFTCRKTIMLCYVHFIEFYISLDK